MKDARHVVQLKQALEVVFMAADPNMSGTLHCIGTAKQLE